MLGNDNGHKMRNMMRRAEDAGIVMTCSTHDEGSRIDNAYPAGYKDELKHSLLVLAACDKYGTLLRDVEREISLQALWPRRSSWRRPLSRI